MQLGLANKAIFIGHVDDIEKIYDMFDLLVQPSICIEGFGRTLIEAMAMQLSVISTRAGGATEVVEDGIRGVLVPPNNVSELTWAILCVMTDKDLAQKMGQEGRQRVKKFFTMDKHVAEIVKVYHDIMGRSFSMRARRLSSEDGTHVQ